AIAIGPNIDVLPLPPIPIPMGGEEKGGRRVPPTAQIVVTVALGEAAGVQNGVLGTDGRIMERAFFAPVVEAGPKEKPGQVGPGLVIFPDPFDAVLRVLAVRRPLPAIGGVV